MTRRGMTLAVSASLLAVLAFLAAGLRVPYVALTPGPVYNTLGMTGDKQIIQVKGHASYPPKGRLDLTTVSVQGAPGYRPITLFDALRYWVNPDVAIVPKEVHYPPDQDEEEIEKEVAKQMTESQDAAKVAALRQLGEKVTTSRLVIVNVTEGQPAAGILQRDDEIETVDGKPVKSAQQLRDAITQHRPGEQVKIGYVRKGKPAEAAITTAAAPGEPTRAIIGVEPEESCPCTTPYDVDIALGEEVGGPSAGLMFSLAIIDTVTPGELTGGVHIAGTGTVDFDGQVGAIGGIHQKLVGARDVGAEHFLVPDGNWEQAQRDPPVGLRLHRVATVAEALSAVCDIGKVTDAPCKA